MQLEHGVWTEGMGAGLPTGGGLGAKCQLVLAFGSGDRFSDPAWFHALKSAYPQARVVGCSTAGEISQTTIHEGCLVVTALAFERPARVECAVHDIANPADSFQVGVGLAERLPPAGLRHVLVFSDGTKVNGSELARGLASVLPGEVAVTGGLSGDGDRFERTLVAGDEPPRPDKVACIGLYGESLRVGFGSLGGWDPFGLKRRITRARGNELFELDGRPALALYRRYLGEHAAELPAAGLLFPLSITVEGKDKPIVRTILGVHEDTQSMTFAGDIPEGGVAQLMKANFDRLVDGAHGAAEASRHGLGRSNPDFALLVSCVGRRLVLKQRTEEELEAVREVLGPRALLSGFYSYGEICPSQPNANCELHNQTMTITTLTELM